MKQIDQLANESAIILFESRINSLYVLTIERNQNDENILGNIDIILFLSIGL